MTAIGSVSSFRIGLRIVFSTPKTAAATTSAPNEPWKVTPLRIPAAIASTTAFAAHETTSQRSTRSMLQRRGLTAA